MHKCKHKNIALGIINFIVLLLLYVRRRFYISIYMMFLLKEMQTLFFFFSIINGWITHFSWTIIKIEPLVIRLIIILLALILIRPISISTDICFLYMLIFLLTLNRCPCSLCAVSHNKGILEHNYIVFPYFHWYINCFDNNNVVYKQTFDAAEIAKKVTRFQEERFVKFITLIIF